MLNTSLTSAIKWPVLALMLLVAEPLAAKTNAELATQGVNTNTSFAASVRINANGQLVVILQKEDKEPVRIAILTEKGQYLFEEKESKHTNILKRYDLDQLPAGRYLVKLTRGGELFTREITIK